MTQTQSTDTEQYRDRQTDIDTDRQTDRQNTKVQRPKVVPSLSSPMASSRCEFLGTGGTSNLPERFVRGLFVQFVPTEWGRLTCTNHCLHQTGMKVGGSILLHIARMQPWHVALVQEHDPDAALPAGN